MELDDAGRAAIPTPVRNLLHELPKILTPRGDYTLFGLGID
jgi:hypothetical protein